jgi:hypothetical protein
MTLTHVQVIPEKNSHKQICNSKNTQNLVHIYAENKI